MKLAQKLRGCAVAIACCGMLTPSVTLAGAPTQAKAPISVAKVQTQDVVLQKSGILKGSVVDAQGRPQNHVQVRLIGMQKEVATATDAAGRFEVAGLKNGVYRLQTPQTTRVVRLWNSATAPPAARDGLLVVNNSQMVRGQGLDGSVLTHPLIIGSAIAAAIAIPIAVNNSSDDDGSKTP